MGAVRTEFDQEKHRVVCVVGYVFNPDGEFARDRCNPETVILEQNIAFDEMLGIKRLIEIHFEKTQSPLARRLLKNWKKVQDQIVKVLPREYKQALERLAKESAA